MKAFLLAAGKGERLKPFTDHTPKCLLPIKGTPLLGIWLRRCKTFGITEVLINTHHLADLVEDYVKKNCFGVEVETYYEESLLGSAGTVLANRDFVQGEDLFFVIYTDNLTNVDLRRMLQFHEDSTNFFTLGLFRTENPGDCGIVEIGLDGIVTSFVEKPSPPISNLANAGIYVASEQLFDYIPTKRFTDFGFDVLPRLVGLMRGFIIEDYILDIGTPQNYFRACREWSESW